MEVKGILAEALNGVKRVRSISPKEWVEFSALRWELYAVFQNILEAMAMIVADLGLRKPSSYADLASTLKDYELLDEHFSTVAKKIASTRNLLVYAYRKFSPEDLNSIITGILPEAEKLVLKLLETLENKNIDPQFPPTELASVFKKHDVAFAYIFGSRARNTAREDSDYDIAVFFRNNNVTVLDEITLGVDVAENLRIPADKVDIVALNKADTILIARVFKEGRVIYSEDEELRRKWERETYLKILGETDLTNVYVDSVLKKRLGTDRC
ncbi:MAG: HepT-like ribonuclease domain-containing protein [Thermoproteota archaeon]